MNYRPLGSTGFKVSEVGFGSWQLGGKGWGTPSSEGAEAVLRALEIGFNLFDTAPVYGFGRAEEILGKTLRAGGKPEDAVLVSKGGLVWDDRKRVAHDSSPEALRGSLEGSLMRLRRERIEVFILHWPDPAVPLAESLSTLEDMRSRGKIGAWGLSNFPAEDVLRLGSDFPHPPPIVLEYPLNWLRRYAGEHAASAASSRELARAASSRCWGFLAFDVLARGLLGGRYAAGQRFGKRDIRSRDERFAPASFQENLARAKDLSLLAGRLGLPPAVLAVRAVLELDGVSSVLVGLKAPWQVNECALASGLSLPGDVLETLWGK
jgi:aryl-alcohol dehydrogenase-like predicted oxidoreductase